MKFRSRNAPLLLFVVPFVSALSAAAQDNKQSTVTKAEPRDAAKLEPVIDLTKSKFDVGTKDAPVDGKDGKPHAGPFVGSEKDQKPKTGSLDGELVGGKVDGSELVIPDGSKIPQVNDGVMDDPNRQIPKQGTTGTEGGVSEKDKARKAHEGQTGEKLEKKPDSPKEAPPLPLSEENKKPGEKSNADSGKTKSKDIGHDDDDTAESLAGLEV
jgi:Ca2+/H+ antiporter, TMEM165/GDT1 family